MDTNKLLHIGRPLPRGRARSCKQEQCTLRNLPVEMVCRILEYLPAESVTAFALTCRSLFRFCPRPAQLSDHARTKLLEWLERDIPELYICYDCGRLGRWHLDPTSMRGLVPREGLCRIGSLKVSIADKYLQDVDMNFTCTLARLVMNRHLYGPGHGPSLQDISVTSFDRGWLSSVDMQRSWSAKIIDNSLYLHGITVYRKSSKKGDKGSVRDYLSRFGFLLVCRHLALPYQGYLPSVPIIPELAPSQDPTRPFNPTDGKIRSCSICFTDYRIQIYSNHCSADNPVQQPIEEDWVVEIARWHKLGECRSPQDLEWYTLATGYHDGVEVRRQDICAAGMVRREWMGGDTQRSADDVEAVFILAEPPPLNHA